VSTAIAKRRVPHRELKTIYAVVAVPDTASVNYMDGTFRATETAGDSATITFNGTGIWVYGARRPNHDSECVG
jgi:hypothetical protein